MDITNFQIVFDNPACTYTAGENVTGKVIITFSRSRKICSLNLKIKCTSHVQWSDIDDIRCNFGFRRNRTRYSAKEEIYQYYKNLVSKKDEFIVIPEGKHIYSFCASLPNDIPSSFEGKYGFIRYIATATLQQPWKYNQEAKALFTVTSPVDLNCIEIAKTPVTVEAKKSFCCCCCKSGTIYLDLWLPFSGYIQGQAIPLCIVVNNLSNLEVQSIIISLEKIITWKAVYPTIMMKQEIIEISKLALHGVAKNHKILLEQLLPVSCVTPTNFNKCSLINSSFRVSVTAAMSWFHSDLVVGIPVYLGTIPFHRSEELRRSEEAISLSPYLPSGTSTQANANEYKDRNTSVSSFKHSHSLDRDRDHKNEPQMKKLHKEKQSLNLLNQNGLTSDLKSPPEGSNMLGSTTTNSVKKQDTKLNISTDQSYQKQSHQSDLSSGSKSQDNIQTKTNLTLKNDVKNEFQSLGVTVTSSEELSEMLLTLTDLKSTVNKENYYQIFETTNSLDNKESAEKIKLESAITVPKKKGFTAPSPQSSLSTLESVDIRSTTYKGIFPIPGVILSLRKKEVAEKTESQSTEKQIKKGINLPSPSSSSSLPSLESFFMKFKIHKKNYYQISDGTTSLRKKEAVEKSESKSTTIPKIELTVPSLSSLELVDVKSSVNKGTTNQIPKASFSINNEESAISRDKSVEHLTEAQSTSAARTSFLKKKY